MKFHGEDVADPPGAVPETGPLAPPVYEGGSRG